MRLSLIVAAACTALVALFFTDLFANLPEPTLGAIVIVAVSGMMKVGDMKRYWRVRKEDFWLAMSALVGVLLFLGIGNILSIVTSFAVSIPMGWAIFGMVFCTLVGVTFGMLPAIKAAKLNPIDALHSD